MSTYTCAACRGTFTATWTDAEAMEEYAANGFTLENEPTKVCDDCYQTVMAAYGRMQ